MSTPAIPIPQPSAATPLKEPVYDLKYPTFPTEGSPSRFETYQTADKPLWDEYLSANRIFCDMNEDMLATVIIDDETRPGPWCPPEGYPEGQGPAEAGKKQGVPASPAVSLAEGFLIGLRGVEGVLVVCVMILGSWAILVTFLLGLVWLVTRLGRKEMGGGDEDEDDDEEEEEEEEEVVAVVAVEGRWGLGKGGKGMDEEGDAIPLLEKPVDAKLAAEKYYM